MSYSKIQVRYYGDGISLDGKNTRQNVEKKVTIPLPKKVIEYGDFYGYDSMYVTSYLDHLIIKGGGATLLDKDINGSSREYISRIVGYEWLDENGNTYKSAPTTMKTEPVIAVQEPVKKNSRKFALSSTDKKIAGVCGGIASWLGVNSLLVRVIAFLTYGFFFWGYILLWAIMPRDDK